MLLLCSAQETLTSCMRLNQLLTVESPKFLSPVFPGSVPPVCTICATLSQGSLHLASLPYLPLGPYSASGQPLSSPTSFLFPSITDPRQENGPDQFWEFRSWKYHRRYTNFKLKVGVGVPKVYLLFPTSTGNSSPALFLWRVPSIIHLRYLSAPPHYPALYGHTSLFPQCCHSEQWQSTTLLAL